MVVDDVFFSLANAAFDWRMVLYHAADAGRRRSGYVVRQEPGAYERR